MDFFTRRFCVCWCGWDLKSPSRCKLHSLRSPKNKRACGWREVGWVGGVGVGVGGSRVGVGGLAGLVGGRVLG